MRRLDSQLFAGAIFRHPDGLASSQFRLVLGKVVSTVLGLVLIASRVFGERMLLATTDGQLAPAAPTPIVTPASYVVSFHGKERDRGNGNVV
jgi:hypothetical protein